MGSTTLGFISFTGYAEMGRGRSGKLMEYCNGDLGDYRGSL